MLMSSFLSAILRPPEGQRKFSLFDDSLEVVFQELECLN